ncbi:MAG: S9 family peptidase, partial [Chitinophagaceae bacterium]
MQKIICLAFLASAINGLYAQPVLTKLTVEKIMRDPRWMGSSPSNPQWSVDGKTLSFSWNPDHQIADSSYFIGSGATTPLKATLAQKQAFLAAGTVVYSQNFQSYTFSKDGDVYYYDLKPAILRRITNTSDAELNPQFSYGDTRIVYARNQNLYAWDIKSGETLQLTNIKTGKAPSPTTGKESDSLTLQETWLKQDQLQHFDVLKARKELKNKGDAYTSAAKPKELRSIYIGNKILQGLQVSPDGRFVSYRLQQPATNTKTTQVPSYVTETAFTNNLPARAKVGTPSATHEFFIYDRITDTVILVKTDSVPGIMDLPLYLNDYPKQLEIQKKKPVNRNVIFYGPYWSPRGKHAVVDIRSDDNKDRWLMLWDTAAKQLRILDRQHDEAWIGGPGIGGNIGWLDDHTCWYQSEQTGYSHLYTINIGTSEKKALTQGSFEVQKAQLSRDKKYFYIS